MKNLLLALPMLFCAYINGNEKIYVSNNNIILQKDCLIVVNEQRNIIADTLKKDDQGFFVTPSYYWEKDGSWTCWICQVNTPSKPFGPCPFCKDN